MTELLNNGNCHSFHDGQTNGKVDDLTRDLANLTAQINNIQQSLNAGGIEASVKSSMDITLDNLTAQLSNLQGQMNNSGIQDSIRDSINATMCNLTSQINSVKENCDNNKSDTALDGIAKDVSDIGVDACKNTHQIENLLNSNFHQTDMLMSNYNVATQKGFTDVIHNMCQGFNAQQIANTAGFNANITAMTAGFNAQNIQNIMNTNAIQKSIADLSTKMDTNIINQQASEINALKNDVNNGDQTLKLLDLLNRNNYNGYGYGYGNRGQTEVNCYCNDRNNGHGGHGGHGGND